MTLNEYLRTVAFALNDDEPGKPFQRYPLKDMIAAYNAAMCLVAKYRKDLFTELKSVKLQPGKYQDLRACCGEVLDVLEQTDSFGNILRTLGSTRDRRTTVKRVWKKPSCLAAAAGLDFIIENVDIDMNLHGRFSVDPPVPCDAEVFALVKCVVPPCTMTEANLNMQLVEDCIHNVASWHYILSTMLTGDQFANAAGGTKNYHYRMFFDILGVVQRQEDRLESREQAT